MSGRAARNLYVYAPDGTPVVIRTAGTYDVAGIIRLPRGEWVKAAVGWAWDSVKNRAKASCYIHNGTEMHVGMLYEETAPVIREYFGTHAVRVVARFTPGEGWTDGLRMSAGKSALRKLAMDGFTAVRIGLPGQGRVADFEMTEIARSARFRMPGVMAEWLRSMQ